MVYNPLEGKALKNNTLLITLCAVAGSILVAIMGVSITHIGSTDIHYPKDVDVVHVPEFQQFQQRIIDRLDDIKFAQQIMQEDIKTLMKQN